MKHNQQEQIQTKPDDCSLKGHQSNPEFNILDKYDNQSLYIKKAKGVQPLQTVYDRILPNMINQDVAQGRCPSLDCQPLPQLNNCNMQILGGNINRLTNDIGQLNAVYSINQDAQLQKRSTTIDQTMSPNKQYQKTSNNKSQDNAPIHYIIDMKQQQDKYKKIGSGGFGSVYQQDVNTVYKVVQMTEIPNKDPEVAAKLLKQQKANIKCINNEILIYRYLQQRKYAHMLSPQSYIQNQQLTGILLERAHINLLDYLNFIELDKRLINFNSKVYLFLHVLQQILVSIKDLHEAGVVHCDIKPQNIMLKFDQMGKIKIFLIDFGLSYIQNEPLPGIQGTETYVDPQFIWTGTPTPWCDLWSVCSLILQLFAEDHDFRVIQISCLKKMKEIQNYQQVLQRVIDNRINQIKQPHIQKILKFAMKVHILERADINSIILMVNQQIKEANIDFKTQLDSKQQECGNIGKTAGCQIKQYKDHQQLKRTYKQQQQYLPGYYSLAFIDKVFQGFNYYNKPVPVFKYYKQIKQLISKKDSQYPANCNILAIYMISDNIIIKQTINTKQQQQPDIQENQSEFTKYNTNMQQQCIKSGYLQVIPSHSQVKKYNDKKHNILVSNLKGNIYFNNSEFLTIYKDTLKLYHLQYLKYPQCQDSHQGLIQHMQSNIVTKQGKYSHQQTNDIQQQTNFKFKQKHMSYWDCIKIKKHQVDKQQSNIYMILQFVNSNLLQETQTQQSVQSNPKDVVFLLFNDKTRRHIIIRFTDIHNLYQHLNFKSSNTSQIQEILSKYNFIFTTYIQHKLVTTSINGLYNTHIQGQLLDLVQFATQYINKNQMIFGTFISNDTGKTY